MNILQRSVLNGTAGVKRLLYAIGMSTGGPMIVLKRFFLGRHPLRRLSIIGFTIATIGMLFVAVNQVSRPFQTGAAVAGYVFGQTGDTPSLSEPGSLQDPVGTSGNGDEDTYPQPCDAPVPVGRPEVIRPDGTAGPEARKVMKEIPKGADMAAAQGYMLYRWAHPDSEFPRDWQDWIDTFYAAGSTQNRAGGTGLNAVQTMDAQADYSPYVRLSRAAVFRLVDTGRITADPARLNAEMQELMTECVRPDSGGR